MLSLLNKNVIYAMSLILLGLTAFSVYVIVYNLDKPQNLVESSRIKTNIIDDCATKARELKIEDVKPLITKNRKSLVLSQNVVVDPMDMAIKTSVLQNYCSKLVMTEYCLGNECQQSENETPHQFKMILSIADK